MAALHYLASLSLAKLLKLLRTENCVRSFLGSSPPVLARKCHHILTHCHYLNLLLLLNHVTIISVYAGREGGRGFFLVDGKKEKKKMEEERDVGIICVIIYDDLALEAWTQRKEREREKTRERSRHTHTERKGVCVCVCMCVCVYLGQEFLMPTLECRLKAELKVPALPEMVFGSSGLQLLHIPTGLSFRFGAKEALQAVTYVSLNIVPWLLCIRDKPNTLEHSRSYLKILYRSFGSKLSCCHLFCVFVRPSITVPSILCPLFLFFAS